LIVKEGFLGAGRGRVLEFDAGDEASGRRSGTRTGSVDAISDSFREGRKIESLLIPSQLAQEGTD
jgi:hypothetical protein